MDEAARGRFIDGGPRDESVRWFGCVNDNPRSSQVRLRLPDSADIHRARQALLSTGLSTASLVCVGIERRFESASVALYPRRSCGVGRGGFRRQARAALRAIVPSGTANVFRPAAEPTRREIISVPSPRPSCVAERYQPRRNVMKRLVILAAASGLVLSSAAYAQSTSSQHDNVKANESSAKMKHEQKTRGSLGAPATTGAAPNSTTTQDPRDSNAAAKGSNKARANDAKEQP
jgi:hypothetical protein